MVGVRPGAGSEVTLTKRAWFHIFVTETEVCEYVSRGVGGLIIQMAVNRVHFISVHLGS